ncbi:MAG: hypothetical protein RL410_1565 [Actinomycetota bacterium]
MVFDVVNERMPRRSRILGIVVVICIVLVAAFTGLAGFITDRMWFDSVGATGVFDHILLTKIALFVVGGAFAALVVGSNIVIAFMQRPSRVAGFKGFDQIGGAASARKLALYVVPALAFLVAGSELSSKWQTWMLFGNSQPFNQVDATFGLDLSFFVFQLPMWKVIQGIVASAVFAAILASFAVHYLFGSMRPSASADREPQSLRDIKFNFNITDGARKHLAVLAGLYLVLRAWGLWLERFELTTQTDSLITGLKFVDANVGLPSLNIMVGITVVVALLFFFNFFQKNYTLPVLGAGLLILSSVALQGIWPGFVQQVQVKPDEQAKEAPFIEHNIAATRSAYGLEGVNYTTYDAVETPVDATLKKDADTIDNIRVLDPYVVSSTFEQLQQLKGFYNFADSLDVSRYTIDGKVRGTMLSVREVNLQGIPESQRNWVTNHLIYTHGIGLAAAFDNTATSDGQPAFIESDVPPAGLLGIKEPRIYFGENSPVYSIVGGSGAIELDYPDDTKATGQQTTTYTGQGGVAIGGLFNKLLFATRFMEPNIVLSEQVTENSRILFNREPVNRVKALAPWLTIDGDPYPAVVDGRIVWIIDGLTTTNQYPYSQSTTLSAATADSGSSRTTDTDINYIRNGVKATVDAFDGTVTLYAWDETDPIVKAWSNAFPGLIQPKTAIPDSLLSQLRYPEDLFKVQRNIMRKYHITDPKAFFTGENFWIIPDDPTSSVSGLPQPPYYLNMRMPDAEKRAFMLTSTFAPAKRPSLAAFMAVNSDPGPDYGKITLLQLPSQTTIPGPVQAQNIFESDPTISAALSLLRRGGSDTVQGNLLSLPIGGGILYVEPVYIKATGSGGYPLLRKVMVGFGQKVVMADNISAALKEVLGTGQSTTPVDPGTPTGTAAEKLAKALSAAQKAYDDGQAALKQGDFSAYGAAQKRLAAAIKQAQAASAELAK